MGQEILPEGGGSVVCVAVFTAVGAGIIEADIYGGHAAAFTALIGVLSPVKGLAGDSLKKRTVDTAAVGDAEFTQVDGLGTGLRVRPYRCAVSENFSASSRISLRSGARKPSSWLTFPRCR